jgi:NTP pyrophosphatase (non-canonical NTP hydrolase)
MNVEEHLLICLAEECAEVAQACSKALRFGLADQWPERGDITNAENIARELEDLFGVVRMLYARGMIRDCDNARTLAKSRKVANYMAYARARGTLEPERA